MYLDWCHWLLASQRSAAHWHFYTAGQSPGRLAVLDCEKSKYLKLLIQCGLPLKQTLREDIDGTKLLAVATLYVFDGRFIRKHLLIWP